MKKEKWISNIFLIGGAVNIVGVLVFSKLFTNVLLNQIEPGVFSNEGLVLIMVWGLAYISLANYYHQAPWVAGVFAIEKFVYVGIWVRWATKYLDTLGEIFAKDWLTGFFCAVYGANDFLFGVFFLYVFWRFRKP
jgi:hypothetical protein